MTNGLLSFDDEACQSWVINPWNQDSQYAPTPGNFGRTPGTLYSLSPTPDPTSRHTRPDDFGFLPFAEWERWGENNYEGPEEQEFIRYTLLSRFPSINALESKAEET